MNRNKQANAEILKQKKEAARRRKKRLAYVPKFPGLISQPTVIQYDESELHKELTEFHERACVTDERRSTMEVECREIVRALMPSVKRNEFHLRFFEALLPDFNTVEVVDSTEVDVLLPLEMCRHKVEYMEPGYSTVFIKKPLDEDNEEGGWANLTELFKKYLSRDSKFVSPVLVVKVVHSILSTAINKVSGTTVVFDDSSKRTDASKAMRFRTTSARSTQSRFSGGSAKRVVRSSSGNRQQTTENRSTPSLQIKQPEIATPRDEQSKNANDVIGSRRDDGTVDKNGQTFNKLNENNESNSLNVPNDMFFTPPTSRGSRVSETNEAPDSPEITRRLVYIENVGISDFFIDKTKGARIQLRYKSIKLNIIPALPIVDEFGAQSFLITRTFQYDAVPKSHKRWRHCHLLKERRLLQAMKYADQGMRTKALEIMYGLTQVDQALLDITSKFIKTVMLHAFDEEVDVTPRWQRQDVESISRTLLRELLNYVTEQNLPSFFERGHNLISGMQTSNFVRLRSRLALLCSSDSALMRALKLKVIEGTREQT